MENLVPTRSPQHQTKKTLEPIARPGRKSHAVPLVLAASTMLAGCSPKQARDEYLSQEDCQKDWGRPELCQPAPASSSGSSSGAGGYGYYRYYGPSYDLGDRDNAQRSARIGGRSFGLQSGEVSNHSVARSVARGGFGGVHISGGG